MASSGKPLVDCFGNIEHKFPESGGEIRSFQVKESKRLHNSHIEPVFFCTFCFFWNPMDIPFIRIYPRKSWMLISPCLTSPFISPLEVGCIIPMKPSFCWLLRAQHYGKTTKSATILAAGPAQTRLLPQYRQTSGSGSEVTCLESHPKPSFVPLTVNAMWCRSSLATLVQITSVSFWFIGDISIVFTGLEPM